MALDNYHDVSIGGSDIGTGFQFEFYCQHCDRRWKSPFKPYRLGYFTGLLTRFAYLFTDLRNAGRAADNFSDMGYTGALHKALVEAQDRAASLYTECGKCHRGVCADCFDTRQDSCTECAGHGGAGAQGGGGGGGGASAGGAMCPNCNQPNSGGRFCAECGFDMASTHKSCPTCAAMSPRSSRFCVECGHGF